MGHCTNTNCSQFWKSSIYEYKYYLVLKYSPSMNIRLLLLGLKYLNTELFAHFWFRNNWSDKSIAVCVVNRKVARASQIGFLCILFCILKSQCVVPAYNQMPFGCVLRNTSDIFTTVSSTAWCGEIHLYTVLHIMQNARQYGGKKMQNDMSYGFVRWALCTFLAASL